MARVRSTSIDRAAIGPAPSESRGGQGARRAEIGPNAVTQLYAALRRADLEPLALPIFTRAEVADWLAAPPVAMVSERRVAALHRQVRAALPPGQARRVMADAGRLTADYLLANRIPRPVGIVLKLLPPRLAAPILVGAIRSHAWTFAGSGRFSARAGMPTVLEIAGNPLCVGETAVETVCAWHAAVFQRLFEVLVSRTANVTQTDCEAAGGCCCRFQVRWGNRA